MGKTTKRKAAPIKFNNDQVEGDASEPEAGLSQKRHKPNKPKDDPKNTTTRAKKKSNG
jgi:hypothetical protein